MKRFFKGFLFGVGAFIAAIVLLFSAFWVAANLKNLSTLEGFALLSLFFGVLGGCIYWFVER